MQLFYFVLFFYSLLHIASFQRQPKSLQSFDDIKELKKILKTKTNVLILFKSNDRVAKPLMPVLLETAEVLSDRATIIQINCDVAKKLCKKLKVNPTNYELKHFKDGEFNKDYDRPENLKSLTSFLKDPTGDLPWDEDVTAVDILHIADQASLSKTLKKQKLPMLVMFYAPWCGHCKRLKPEYASAATELKSVAIMAVMDLDKPENYGIRTGLNITGFPTLKYFVDGDFQFDYGGENNKDGLISWMEDPKPPEEKKGETEWQDEPSDVVHLHDADFDEFLAKNPSVLVMFYAPWCGHCKNMKPDYTTAAKKMKDDGIAGVLAAVDATKEKKVAGKFKVEGFPAVKYFKEGVLAFDIHERTEEKIINFMKNPNEPPPPPPPESTWADEESLVLHLTDETFKNTLKKKKHVLVMFYAPWCGHCKNAKPEFTAAAKQLEEENKIALAAVDCTVNKVVCGEFKVEGFPTMKYFSYGQLASDYESGRTQVDFVNFLLEQSGKISPGATHFADVDEAGNLVHLGQENFDEALKQYKQVLVMFYAPWCGHCKAMKPAYAVAAAQLKEKNINAALAAVDGTKHPKLSERFGVKGYPTVKYFENGELKGDYDEERTLDKLVSFIVTRSAPPATPPPTPTPAPSKEDL